MMFVYQMEYLMWDSVLCVVEELKINNGNKTQKNDDLKWNEKKQAGTTVSPKPQC